MAGRHVTLASQCARADLSGCIMSAKGDLPVNYPLLMPTRPLARRSVIFSALAIVAFAFLSVGCHQLTPLDTKPLDNAGMSYDTIQQLKALKITAAEVAEIANARQGGLSDAGCVQAVQTYHGRGEPFHASDAIGRLLQVGMSEETVLELAKMNQMGLGAGELLAMRLAGFSDTMVLEVARRHAEGKPVLSGASLASLKNAGLRESTLLELVRRGLTDPQADTIISLRRHGVSEAEILRRFHGA